MVVRFGLLGAGDIARTYADAIGTLPDAHVSAVWSRDSGRAALLAASSGARVVPEAQQLCAADDVDVVVIATPNDAHLAAVRLAARASKAVACTKPLGRTATEAAEMLRLVEDAGVWHGYADSAAFSARVIAARDAVRSGELGTVHSIHLHEGHPGPGPAHFRDHARTGGGALIDMGSHSVAAVRVIAGIDDDVAEVFCAGSVVTDTGPRPASAGDVEDLATATLRLRSGLIAQITASWAEPDGVQIRQVVTGTHGARSHTLREDDADPYGFIAQFRHFTDAFRAGRLPDQTFRDGLAVNRIIDACHHSLASGTRQFTTPRTEASA